MAKLGEFWQYSALVVIAVSATCSALDCNVDSDCLAFGGEFSECVESSCACEEYYVWVNATGVGLCMKTATNGGKCTYDAQCQGAMGHNSKCFNHGTGMCHCLSTGHEGLPVKLYKGKCVVARLLGQPCSSDAECVLGGLLLNNTAGDGGDDGGDHGDHSVFGLYSQGSSSVFADEEGVLNEFAVCSPEGVCTCGMDHHVFLHTMDNGGLCMTHCEGCSSVEISVFAITTLASAGVFVLIVVGCLIMQRKR